MQNGDIRNVVNHYDVRPRRHGEESTGEVLEAIELLGNYYVNNIRTYSYQAGVKQYIATLSNEATERDVVKHGGNSLYQYELFEGHDKTPVIITENLNWDDGNGYGDVDYNIHADYIGNDCSDFAQAVILMVSNGYRGDKNLSQYPKFKDTGKEKLEKHDYKKIDKYKQYDSLDGSHAQTKGIRLHDTDARTMQGQEVGKYNTLPINFENAMLELGYKKYFLNKDNKWHSKVNNPSTGEQVEEVEGIDFEPININFLEPGDLLCRNGHVEFYYGYDKGTYNFENNTYIRGKRIQPSGNTVKSTFGWGNGTIDKFPKDTTIITFYDETRMFDIYDVIYRKVN